MRGAAAEPLPQAVSVRESVFRGESDRHVELPHRTALVRNQHA